MTDHAILVHITTLPDDAGLDEIEDPLIEAMEAAGVGEFDGNDIGGDGALLDMDGPDADHLRQIAEPVLRAAPLGPGSYASNVTANPGRVTCGWPSRRPAAPSPGGWDTKV